MRFSLNGVFIAAVLISAPLTAVSAADLPVNAPPPPACIWCGWYGGLNAGYANSSNRFSTVSTPTPDAVVGVVPGVTEGIAALSTAGAPVGSISGFIGGAQVGYNWQSDKLLAGVEADIQALSPSGGSGSTTNTAVVVGVPVTSMQTATMSTSYVGTLRGRLGLVVTPPWLTYVTGGLALGEVKASDTLAQTGTNGFIGAGSGTLSGTRVGWALGVGSEWMFAPMWSLKGEYLHYDLGTGNFTSAPTGAPASAFFAGATYQTNMSSVHFQGNIFRAGVNYHF